MAYHGFKPAEQAIQIGADEILSSHISDGVIVNADINSSAAIATSKISGALTSVAGSHGLGSLAALSAVASAQITDGTIVNADINASAAIAYSKLGTIPTFNQSTTGQAGTVATIAGLAPNTATTQATQASITSTANLATVGTITTGVWNAGAVTSSGNVIAGGGSGVKVDVNSIEAFQQFYVQANGAYAINFRNKTGADSWQTPLLLNTDNSATFAGTITTTSAGLANAPSLAIDNPSSTGYIHAIEAFGANMTQGQTHIFCLGKEGTTKNTAVLGYKWDSAGSNDNLFTVEHWGTGALVTVDGVGNATFAGNITSDHIYSTTNNTYNLGSGSNYWANGYIYNVDCNTLVTNSTATFGGNVTVPSFRSGSASTYFNTGADGGGTYIETIGAGSSTRKLRIQGINDAGTTYSSINLDGGASEIYLTTNNVERMRINGSGDVNVVGDFSLGGTLTLGDGIIVDTGRVFMKAQDWHFLETNTHGDNSHDETIKLSNTSETATKVSVSAQIDGHHRGEISWHTDNGDYRGKLKLKVRPLTSVGAYREGLVINSDGDVSGTHSSQYHVSSDVRLKKDVVTIPDALDKVLALRGVNFKWKDKEDKSLMMGMIAQETELVIPEVVNTQDNEEGIKAIDYQFLPAILVEAIKELNAKITALENA